MDVEADLKGCRVVWRGGGLSKHRRRLSAAASSRRDLTLPSPAAASLCVPKRCGSTAAAGHLQRPHSATGVGGGVPGGPLKSVDRDTPLRFSVMENFKDVKGKMCDDVVADLSENICGL